MPELQLKGDVLITCKGCKNRFSIRELRYDKEGKDLICKECFANAKGSSSKQKATLRQIPTEQLEPTGPRMRDAPDLMNYYCFVCRYKFSRKADFKFENCPSCGKLGSIRKNTPLTSSQLLEEADDIFG